MGGLPISAACIAIHAPIGLHSEATLKTWNAIVVLVQSRSDGPLQRAGLQHYEGLWIRAHAKARASQD